MAKKKQPKNKEPEVLIIKTPDPYEAPLRLDRNARWPSKPSEHFEQRRKIFKSYLENQLDYSPQDIVLLLKLWDMEIDSKNIMGYVHLSTQAIYQGIINDNLKDLYRPSGLD